MQAKKKEKTDSGEKLVTVPFRLAFADTLFEPEEKTASNGKKYKSFGCRALFQLDPPTVARPGETDLRNLKIALYEFVKKARPNWAPLFLKALKEQWPSMPEVIEGRGEDGKAVKFGQPFRNGDLKDWDGFAGHVFLNLRTNQEPGLFVKGRVAEVGEIYPGCFVRASVFPNIYPASSGPEGINLILKSLQFVKDGEAFKGGSKNTADDFPSMPDSDQSSPAAGADNDMAGL